MILWSSSVLRISLRKGVNGRGVKTGEIYEVKIQNTGGLTFERHGSEL